MPVSPCFVRFCKSESVNLFFLFVLLLFICRLVFYRFINLAHVHNYTVCALDIFIIGQKFSIFRTFRGN